MKCPTCGGDNREGARFCRHCGLAMGASPAGLVTGRAQEETVETGLGQQALPATAGEAPVGSLPDATVELGASSLSPVAELETPQPAGPEASAGIVPDAPVDPGESSPPTVQTEPETPPETGPEALAEVPAEPAPAEAPPPGPAESVESCESCPKPFSPGTVLDGRYLVIEMLDQQAVLIRYVARDLARCWQCGFSANSPDDAFCAQCGASLPGGKSMVSLLQVLDPQAEPPEGEILAARFSEGDAHFLVLRPHPVEPAFRAVPAAGLRILLGQATHPGQVRPLNEDSFLVLLLSGSSLRTQPDESKGLPLLLGLFAVADGMGGHEGGEVASKLALHVFGRDVVRAILSPAVEGRGLPAEGVAALLARAVEAANDAVYLARQKRENDMGTTLTAALVLDERLFLAHVGDCRALLWNAAGLKQLTADHSLVASLVASGRAAPDEVYTHPQRSAILRCIGDRPTVEADTAELALAPGDRLVLCSDGLWEMLRNEGIADVLMQESDPQAAAGLLVARANAAGGDDNITVIVVQAEPA